MNKTNTTIVGALVALVLFFAVNILASSSLRSMRLDLTEEKLYTLSDGSRRIAEGIDEPIRLYLFSSDSLMTEFPPLQSYAPRVRELLEEYTLSSDGNIILEVIDPEPFSEEEDRAVSEGIQGIPIPTGDTLYLGLVGTNAVGDTERIPFLDWRKERFLEYDVSRMIYSLAHPKKRVVAFLSSLPLQGGGAPNPMAPQPSPPWQIVNQIGTLSETRILQPTVEEIPAEVDVLLLIHPKDLTSSALYAIDQYVMGGGRVIAFVDPFSEADQSGADPMNPMASAGVSKASDLGPLLASWGVAIVPDKFVADRKNAMRVQVGSGSRPRSADYVAYLQIGEDGLDAEDPTTSLLTRMFFATAGALRPLEGSTTTFKPLVTSSDESMLMDVSLVQFMPNPENLLTSFFPDEAGLVLAARISGQAQSAFPDGPPNKLPENGEVADDEDGADESTADDETAHRASSEGAINLVVVADSDLLVDRFWIQEERFLGAVLGYRKTSDNGDFAINAVENLSGGDDLISIRAQGRYQRPFERVEDIRREAEQRYLQEKQELEAKRQSIQSQINDIIRGATPGSDLILTPEQEQDLRDKQDEELEIRRKLRDVEYNLRKDIDSLGTKLKWANVLVVPGVVALTAMALGALRVQRRSKKRSGR